MKDGRHIWDYGPLNGQHIKLKDLIERLRKDGNDFFDIELQDKCRGNQVIKRMEGKCLECHKTIVIGTDPYITLINEDIQGEFVCWKCVSINKKYEEAKKAMTSVSAPMIKF